MDPQQAMCTTGTTTTGQPDPIPIGTTTTALIDGCAGVTAGPAIAYCDGTDAGWQFLAPPTNDAVLSYDALTKKIFWDTTAGAAARKLHETIGELSKKVAELEAQNRKG